MAPMESERELSSLWSGACWQRLVCDGILPSYAGTCAISRLDRMDDLDAGGPDLYAPGRFSDGPEQAAGGARGVTGVRGAVLDAEVARWVRESPSFFTGDSGRNPGRMAGDAARARRGARSAAMAAQLGAARARVLEPKSLRQRIAAEAAAMLRHYQPS